MVTPIEGNLYQFTNLAGNMSLPSNQYLLATSPSVMFATGIYDQAKWILPKVKEILGDHPLDYLFISHLEADECGGVFLFKKHFPKLVILSTARIATELPGFGYKGKIIPCDKDGSFTHGPIDLKFYGFPVEVHNRDGLICYETNTGVLYSSDVIVKNSRSSIDLDDWDHEIEGIDASRIPDDSRREHLKDQLRTIKPRLIATGHGACVKIE